MVGGDPKWQCQGAAAAAESSVTVIFWLLYGFRIGSDRYVGSNTDLHGWLHRKELHGFFRSVGVDVTHLINMSDFIFWDEDIMAYKVLRCECLDTLKTPRG